ncbi:MAG: PorT family protein [Bacteroidia bacterium]|nr:PorT family protein [Bacteroidia bacterium]
MKKIIYTFCFVLAAAGIQAQAFGILAGLNFAKGTFDEPSVDNTVDGLTGIQIGPVVQFPMGTLFELHTGAIYSQQGFKLPMEEWTIDYLDVPINIAASFDLGGTGVFVKAGPVLGIGIGGKRTTQVGELDINFGSGDEDDLKVLDVGGSVGAGIKLGTLQVAAAYDLSLSDLSNNEAGYENKVFHISLAFVLGGN